MHDEPSAETLHIVPEPHSPSVRSPKRRSSDRDHLVPLTNEWSVWKTFCLRAPGFAASDVERLASPACANAADDFQSGHITRDELSRVWSAERRRLSAELRRFAASPGLREAVTWQNPNAIATAFDPLLRTNIEATDSKTRQKEALIASYVQRYAVKNESIGFFGPIGWGTVAREGPAITMRPGTEVLAHRQVYFERWAIDALARVLAQTPGIDRWLRPRRNPLLRLDEESGALLSPVGPTEALSSEHRRLFAECHGDRTADAIVRSLGGDPDVWLTELATLRDWGAILWTLDIPSIGQPFEDAIRAQLEEIGDDDLRAQTLGVLEELEAARDAVAYAAGDPDLLQHAIADLEIVFERLTGEKATRHAGRTYGGRTVIYEDCRRDVELTIGPAVMTKVKRPLSLVLKGARWFSHELARAYSLAVHDVFRALGKPEVDFLFFLKAVTPLFLRPEDAPPVVKELIAQYQATWSALLLDAALPGARRVDLDSDTIARVVDLVFDAPGPGVPTARYHSPDIMIAAKSEDAIHRGELTAVLGELHANWNTFEQELFVQEFPDRARFREALLRDIPSGRIGPVIPAGAAGRCHAAHYSEHPLDVTIEHDAVRSARPRVQTIPISALFVRERAGDGSLELVTRDGRRRWDIAAAIEYLLVENESPMLPSRAHTPRIAIDGFVLQREAWRVPASSCTFAHAKDALDRFLGARLWAAELGVPRHAFFKRAGEIKPWFVDFASPLYVEQLCKAIRAAGTTDDLSISEMYPRLDECWLVDREGRRYTSELRMITVDEHPYEPT